MQKARSGQDKALWDRIMEYASEDPLVLSDDHDDHVNKVISENYAYIQDKTCKYVLYIGANYTWAAEVPTLGSARNSC